MKAKYGIERQMRNEKAWGIFKHDVGKISHHLIQGLEKVLMALTLIIMIFL